MRRFFFYFAPIFFLPGVAFAALNVSPVLYNAPASPNYTGANGVQNVFLYFEQGALPICGTAGAGAPPTSGNISSDICTGFGSFPGTAIGQYQLVEPHVASCTTRDYADCISANGGDVAEADFEIQAVPIPPSAGSIPVGLILALIPTSMVFLLSLHFAPKFENFLASMAPSKFIQSLFGRTLRSKKRWYV